MNEPSEKAIEWTVPGAISFRLHVETWDGLGPHHQRPATPADLAAAGYVSDGACLSCAKYEQELQASRASSKALRDELDARDDGSALRAIAASRDWHMAETDRLKRELADLTGAIDFRLAQTPVEFLDEAREMGWTPSLDDISEKAK